MRAVRRCLLGISIVQIVSTLIGFVTLLVTPDAYTFMLQGTVFAGQYLLAAILLGLVVGGFQWVAAVVHLRAPQWAPLAHALAGLVMVGWIFGECLVLNMFIWPHALWGGLGVLQVALVLVLLGVLKPLTATPPVPSGTEGWISHQVAGE